MIRGCWKSVSSLKSRKDELNVRLNIVTEHLIGVRQEGTAPKVNTDNYDNFLSSMETILFKLEDNIRSMNENLDRL